MRRLHAYESSAGTVKRRRHFVHGCQALELLRTAGTEPISTSRNTPPAFQATKARTHTLKMSSRCFTPTAAPLMVKTSVPRRDRAAGIAKGLGMPAPYGVSTARPVICPALSFS